MLNSLAFRNPVCNCRKYKKMAEKPPHPGIEKGLLFQYEIFARGLVGQRSIKNIRDKARY